MRGFRTGGRYFQTKINGWTVSPDLARARVLHRAPPHMAHPMAFQLARRAALLAAVVPCLSVAAPPRAETGDPAPAAAGDCWLVEGKKREPIFAEACASTPVARVDGVAITTVELMNSVMPAHKEHGPDAKVAHMDLRPVVERLIDVRVIALEAREEGIDEIPAVKEKIGKAEEARLKDILKARAMKDAKVDEAQVERAYAEAVTEYKIHLVRFSSKDDALLVGKRTAQGKTFAAVVKDLVAEKKAQDMGEGYVVASKLAPEVRAALRNAKPGTVTSPIAVGGGWSVTLFLETRTSPDAKKTRAGIEEANLAAHRERLLRQYYTALSKKYAKIDRKLLDSLDFEAPKPGVEALMKDKRTLVRFEGGKTVTVADFTAELDKQFFHGVEDAARQKRANNKKMSTFDAMVFRILLLDEAARQNLRQTDEFKVPMRDATDRILFNAFLENAVAPSVQVSDDDCRKYYEAHKAEYATPAFYRLDGIAFSDVKDAQAAIGKLRAGTDFKWARANADGVIAANKQKLAFEALPVTIASLPEGLAAALSGAKEGEYRLYASPEGEYYVVLLVKEFPAGVQPFEAVQEGIKKKIFSEKVAGSIREWAEKIRQHHKIEIYVSEATK